MWKKISATIQPQPITFSFNKIPGLLDNIMLSIQYKELTYMHAQAFY